MCRWRLPIALVLVTSITCHRAASYPTDPVLPAAADETTTTASTPPAHYPSDNGPTTTVHPDTRLVIDSPDDIRPIATDVEVRGSIVFFSASLSMFAAIAVVLFFRKCVTCPSAGRARYHNRPTEGTGDDDPGPANCSAATSGDARLAHPSPNKMDRIALSPSVSSLVETGSDAPDIRPPTRRQTERVGSDVPEALCLQGNATDEEENYV